MTECQGLFGKWFGHKFESFKIQSSVEAPYNINGSAEHVSLVLESICDKYIIRCKRCGKRVDDEG
jgi:hypothetical protein